MSAFTQTFLVDFFQSIHKLEKNNWDHLRFEENHPREKNFMVDNAVYWMHAIMKNIDQYEAAFEILEDDYSKNLMIKLLEFDILDHHHVKLPINTPAFWDIYNNIDKNYLLEKDAIAYGGKFINLYKVPDSELKIYGNPLTVLTQFILQQYYYARGPIIKPEIGDVCIDAGACRGDVSLKFSDSIGPKGQVYGFEFVPANIEVFQRNLEINPHWAANIEIVQHPLWHVSHEEMSFSDQGPGSSISDRGEGNLKTLTITLDDFVASKGLEKVDFIKMDIEGAELNALAGASATIRKFQPKLAICAYHKKDDFYSIPKLIRQIDSGYKFYLDHYTIHREETVLYAIPAK
ncbi:MAG: FkbM family methyltransferase [Rhodothermales bacterium]